MHILVSRIKFKVFWRRKVNYWTKDYRSTKPFSVQFSNFWKGEMTTSSGQAGFCWLLYEKWRSFQQTSDLRCVSACRSEEHSSFLSIHRESDAVILPHTVKRLSEIKPTLSVKRRFYRKTKQIWNRKQSLVVSGPPSALITCSCWNASLILFLEEKNMLFCFGIISVTSALLLLFVFVWFALMVTCELETDCSLSFFPLSLNRTAGFEIKLQPEQTNTRGHKTPPHKPSQHKDTRRHSLQKTENHPVSVPWTSCSFHWIHPKLIPETEQIKAPGCRRWLYRTSHGETPTDPFMETNITTQPGGGGAGRAGDQISSPCESSLTYTNFNHSFVMRTNCF